MGAESNQPDLIRVFVSEASDGTRVLGEALHTDSKQIPPPHEVYEHYIVAHRLRGAAALYGYGGVSRLSAELEVILERDRLAIAINNPGGDHRLLGRAE